MVEANKTSNSVKSNSVKQTDSVPTQSGLQGGWLSQRWPIVVACLFSVVWCFAYAAFRSQLSNDWMQQNGGGVPYTVFWILLAAVVWPSKRLALRICVWAVILICGLEFFQLYNPEPLSTFRRTRLGAALLGSSFVWHDIPPYFIGGLIGWILLKVLGSRQV